MLSARAAALALGLLLGCSSQPGLSPPVHIFRTQKGVRDEVRRARLDLRVTGAEQIDVNDKEVQLRITEILEGNPTSVWLVSVSSSVIPPISLDDGRVLQFTADTAPGLYSGSGRTYTLTGKETQELPGTPGSNLPSGAYVEVRTNVPPLSDHRYDKILEPCAYRIGKDLVTGSVRCPKLADERGKTVSLAWSWQLV